MTYIPLIIAILIVCPLSLSSCPTVQQKTESQPSVRQIMERVVATYHSFSTYSDKGVANIQIVGGGRTVTKRVDFETHFKRPVKLRFQWVTETSYLSSKKRNAIWSDGKGAWASFAQTGNNVERLENFGMAVAAATGISNGTVHTIPRLLTDEVPGRRVDQFQDIQISGYETFNGIECIVLSAIHPNGRDWKIWIGRENFLIYRILETDKGGTTQDEVRTTITVNQDIPDSLFTEQQS